jgi:hypothetical protein
MPAAVSGLLPWSAVCCYLTGHKQCKHQDFQRPGSRWIHAECGIQRGFGNGVCSCNFVICTIKYTHLCIRHGVQTSLSMKEGSLFCFVCTHEIHRAWMLQITFLCLWKALNREDRCLSLVSMTFGLALQKFSNIE